MQGADFIRDLSILITSQKLEMNRVFDVVEKLNGSIRNCRECITILREIFLYQKSKKILFTVELLEYFVKNCTRNFHEAANQPDFQESLIHLLRRQRGKFTIVEKLKSNIQNWTSIEAKTLYIIQLWYDAFILEEGNFKHIIGTYKQLRQEGIPFPPRQENEKNMLTVKTQSPIFENITSIAQHDRNNFEKKKRALGLSKQAQKQPQIINNIAAFTKPSSKPECPILDIDQASQLIMVIRSLDHNVRGTSQQYEKLKKMVQNHRPPPASQKVLYEQVIQEAEKLFREWQNSFKESVINSEEEYMKKKLGGMSKSKIQNSQVSEDSSPNRSRKEESSFGVTKVQEINLIDL